MLGLLKLDDLQPTTVTHAPTARAAPAARPELGMREVVHLCACLIAFAAVLFSPQALSDGDTFWHLAAGRWILEHGRVPLTDPFSFTHYGRPWIAHEWLAELLMALAFGAGGLSGLLSLFAVSFTAAVAMLSARLLRWQGPFGAAVVLAFVFACSLASLLARPLLLALPVMVLWTLQLLEARAHGRAPPLWLAGLMAVWANLHGSFVFGFLVLGPLALEALVEAGRRPWPVARDWGLFGALCLGAAVLTPNGASGLIYPLQIMTMSNLDAIIEWRPVDLAKIGPLELGLLLTGFVVLWRGVRAPPLRAALLLLLLLLTLRHRRHEIVLAFIAPLLLAEPVGRSFGRLVERGRLALATYAFLAIWGAGILGARLWLPLTLQDADNVPQSAIRQATARLAGDRVLNSYQFGGYLIFMGLRPYIDGRSDMYGDAFFARYLRMMGGDQKAFDTTVRTQGVDWTLFTPDEAKTLQMDGKPGWRTVYRDRFAVVHARIDPGRAAN